MSDRFLPKTFESCGVICSPLGRRATVDSIVFRQPLPSSACLEKNFSLWINDNVEIYVYKLNQLWVIEVTVFSLARFQNGRSSSLITDYHDVLLTLNAAVNLELKNRRQSLIFDSFESEIIRLDLFVDLRFKNKSEMELHYENAKKIKIPALPSTTDYDSTFYWHSQETLTASTKVLRLYHKENRKRKNKSDELNKNKLRLETSLQNFNRQKVTTAIAKSIKQPPVSYAVKIQSNDARIKNNHRVYQNKYPANCFTLLNQYAIDTVFYHTAKDILHG